MVIVRWLLELDWPSWIMAASTVVIAVFAIVQVRIERQRREDARRAAASQILAPAWLLRRTLEKALELADSAEGLVPWGREVGMRGGIADMEAHARDILSLGAEAGSSTEEQAQRAFERFIGFIGPLSKIHEALAPSQAENRRVTELERQQLTEQAPEALGYLKAAIEELEKLAPRREYERGLPIGTPKILSKLGLHPSLPENT
jgi:hypothetical protein